MTVTTENGTIKKIEEPIKLAFISGAELAEKEMQPPVFVVEGLVPQGLDLLVAPSKAGKSWMALDMSVSIATGTTFLGKKTNPGTVLYLAYEDSLFRLKDRQTKILNGREAPKNLYLTTADTAADLDHGLIQQLQDFVDQKPDTKMIVIDVFQRARSLSNSRNAYAKDYADTSKLKKFADVNNLVMLLIHHTSKRTDDNDPFAAVNGTTGIMGCSDAIFMLTRTDKETGLATLNVTGRDIPENDYKLKFDKNTFRWKMEGSTEEVQERTATELYEKNPVIRTIRKLLQNSLDKTWTGTATDILSAAAQYGTPIRVTAQQLGKKIESLQDELRSRDLIEYNTIQNGTGSKKHRFSYVSSPFE